jgi:hypothetical protein
MVGPGLLAGTITILASVVYPLVAGGTGYCRSLNSYLLAGTDFTEVFFAAFLAALLDLAQRALCASAIFALPSALITRLIGSAATGLRTACVRLGRPGDLLTAVPFNIALACSKREISESIS